MNVYVWEHIVSLSSRTSWWIFMKLRRDEVLMVPYKYCWSAQGWGQGRAKIGHWGPLLEQTSSSDWKATATNRMHNNDLETCGKKCCYFWIHSEVKFLTRFWRLFGLSHFDLFQCNFYRFLCGKVFNLHLFCVISMFVSRRCLYKRFKCLKNFNEFSMYLFRWRKGEGVALMHVYYEWEHSQPLLQNRLMDVYETW